MAKIIGVDYGTKRVGVAISNDDESVAFPVEVLEGGDDHVIESLQRLCREKKVETIVIGIPHSIGNMRETDMTRQVRKFAASLESVARDVVFEEEFLSTKEARRTAGNAGNVDASAAAIILQSYLERKKNMVV